MRCPACAMDVDPSRQACPYCGSPLPAGPVYYGAQPYPPPAYYPPPAPAYGAPPPYYPPPYGAPPMVAYAPAPPTAAPVAAGVLMLIGGIIALINGIVLVSAGAWLASASDPFTSGYGWGTGICGAVQFMFGLIAVLGAILAIQRRSWGMALLGSILCLLSIGPAGISFILGLVSLILVAVSRQEFP